jgi:hypothetical protein
MRKSLLKRPHYAAAASAGVLALASVFVHPFGAVKANSNAPLLAGANVDPAVVRILEKSCQNCHSERTEWPWYSYVAPASWLIENDVNQGRSHMNLSRWDEYDTRKQHDLLAELAAVVRNRRMPLSRYILLHPGSQPSPAGFERIYQWTRTERRRLTLSAQTRVAPRLRMGPPASNAGHAGVPYSHK